ncbi:hypothetical protein [Streptomyces sp. NPDC047976]|uniref:hypothetical protein n=1 Tax=Streptomyces sp. NPDC047976 TaxID=3155746 RepID=UPI0034268252
MNRLLLAAAVPAAATAVLAGGAWLGWERYREAHAVSEAVHAFDTTDPVLVAPEATAVFTGTVVEDLGRRTVEGLPSDAYRVRVERVLKGSASGEMLVSQSDESDRKYLVGQTYVWATNPATRPEEGVAQLYDAEPRPATPADLAAWTAAVERTRPDPGAGVLTDGGPTGRPA